MHFSLPTTHYKHLFFDLDHTLWDFEANSKDTIKQLFDHNNLAEKGIPNFEEFHDRYSFHNERLWDRYSKGFIKQEELRWKRMWLSLLDFKIADEPLARAMGVQYLALLPSRKKLFPYTVEILAYLKQKGYTLHLITNGFEKVQYDKINNSGIAHYFTEVITSEASNSLKPNKEIFDYALTKSGATVKDSIMIGDNIEADIKGALGAGWDCIFVNHISASPDIVPTYTIYHLQELENIL
ncbi:MAG: YjjG family noncanonical pyrimidine nucleotidase [Sediminibacterium sp.]|nr:YjjG family noncanonical pyrimidine nucleotidase [Sediminibacterium sp.]